MLARKRKSRFCYGSESSDDTEPEIASPVAGTSKARPACAERQVSQDVANLSETDRPFADDKAQALSIPAAVGEGFAEMDRLLAQSLNPKTLAEYKVFINVLYSFLWIYPTT